MNRYIAKQELIVRTQGGKRVKLEAGKYYVLSNHQGKSGHHYPWRCGD